LAADHDVVIVGAGAAGIAAGRRLASSPLSFLIVEAGDRVGGRAWTRIIEGMPLDLGCGWLHSADRNPWTAVAEEAGFEIDRTPPAWGRQFEELGFSRAEQAEANEAWEALDRRLRESPPASDRAADALDPDGRWNAYIDARSGYINGAGLADISVADYLAYDDADSDVNWRLPGGYGALVAASAEGLPIRLGTAVTRIDRRGAPMTLETAQGTLTARAVIVTVPPPVLARGQLRFDPALDDKVKAAEVLPLGLANKLFLALDAPDEFPPDCHLIGNKRTAETGSHYLRPFGRPVIETFFGGAHAWALEAEGEAGAVDFAVEELAALLGSSFRKRVRPLALSAWGKAPYVGGAYSHARPGHVAARARLASAVEDRIFFAGEACSRSDFSTAHGACATGVAAADALLVALGMKRGEGED
jgi:monoamine oxidase